MDSSLFLVLCVALSALSSASGAPTRSGEVNFSECKELSFKLNELARALYNTVESPKISSIIDDPPVSIRPIDACDPLSLQSDKETCQSRIVLALKNYTRIFHENGVFKNAACSKWRAPANQIANVTGDLLGMLKEEWSADAVENRPLSAVNWYDNALCRDSVERLYSFSIISARVFSFLASTEAPRVEMKQC